MNGRGLRKRDARALVRTVLKLAAGLAVLYVLLGLLMFWPIVFHAETTVRVLRTGSTSVHVAWLEPAGDAACFLAIKL